MESRALLWIVSALCMSLLLVSYLPAYSVNRSLAATFVASYVALRIAEAFYWVFLYPVYFTPFIHLATPPGRSIWNGHYSALTSLPAGERSQKWMAEVPNGGIIRMYLMLNSERLLPTSPKALSDVLTHRTYDWVKPHGTAVFLSVILGHGLLSAEGEVHKAQRRNLNPAFSYRHVKDLYPIFWKKGTEMVKGIEKSVASLAPNEQVVNIGFWASRATLDIIGLTGMGQDFNALSGPNNLLHKNYKRLFSDPPSYLKPVRLFFFVVALELYFKLIPWGHNRQLVESSKYIREHARRIIQEKKDKMAKDGARDMDIISLALEGGYFTEESLVSTVMTFLAAGHETTSTSLQWSVYALCNHPDIQKKLRDEIRSSLPPVTDENQTISSLRIDSLAYLNAFCNEVLRFYPPVRMTIRQAIRDTYIQDTFVPKGTIINIVPYAVNRNPELWGPDAHEFKPQRWLEGEKRHTGGAETAYSFLSFLHGPRNCIGAAFGKGELACLVATAVSRFEFELEDPDVKFTYSQDVTVRPKEGIRVKIKVAE